MVLKNLIFGANIMKKAILISILCIGVSSNVVCQPASSTNNQNTSQKKEYSVSNAVEGRVKLKFHENQYESTLNEIFIHPEFKNNTDKVIVGIVYNFSIFDVLGDKIKSQTDAKSMFRLPTGNEYVESRMGWSVNTYQDDYYELLEAHDLDKYNSKFVIKKVIFDDGSILVQPTPSKKTQSTQRKK